MEVNIHLTQSGLHNSNTQHKQTRPHTCAPHRGHVGLAGPAAGKRQPALCSPLYRDTLYLWGNSCFIAKTWITCAECWITPLTSTMQFIPTSYLSFDQANMFAPQSRTEISSNKTVWFPTSSGHLVEGQNQGCIVLRSISSFLLLN